MQNKTLKRQFKKYLGVKSPEDLDSLLSWLRENLPSESTPDNISKFIKNFKVFVEHMDKVLDDNATMVELNERSLVVSTRELTEAQESLHKKNRQQEEVLEKLQELIDKLDMQHNVTLGQDEIGEDIAVEAQAEGVDEIVAVVAALVDTQILNSKLMENLFQAGQALSSSLNLKALEGQIKMSFLKVSGVDLSVKTYFRSDLFGLEQQPIYFPLNEQGECDAESWLVENSGSNYIFVDSAKGEGTLAVIEFDILNAYDKPIIEQKMASIKTLVSVIGNCIENIRFLVEEKKKLFLQNELQTARIVQKALLPPPRVVQVNRVEISGYYQSASECGGDWWNYFPIDNDKALVFVGDVTGHGTASAMLSAVVRGYCDSFPQRPDFDVRELLAELNDIVCKTSQGTNRLMTMSVALIDTTENMVVISNAGHNNPILRRPHENKKLRYMSVSGPTLGLQSDPTFFTRVYDFTPGDTLFMFTDGLVECIDNEEEFYGDSRLRRLLNKMPSDITANEFLNTVQQDMDKFRKGANLNDDVTLVAVNHL